MAIFKYREYMVFFALAVSLASPVGAANISVRECNSIADYVNETMAGMRIDEVTTLRGAVCTIGPTLTYFQIVDSSLSQSDVFNGLSILKKSLVTRWCSNPDQRELLLMLKEVEYQYEGGDGTYYGKVSFDRKDC